MGEGKGWPGGEKSKALRVGARLRVQVCGAVQVLAVATACLQGLTGALGLPFAGRCLQG